MNDFRVHSDLIACRINCKVEEITSIISSLRRLIERQEGTFIVRGLPTDNVEFGMFYTNENKINDIVAYAYAYVPRIGYIMEIQIGHPLASLTFSINSLMRDYKLKYEYMSSTRELKDRIWSFYNKNKKELIETANKSINL